MNTGIVVILTVVQAVLLSAIAAITLTSFTPTAHAQTQGGCPGESHTVPSGTHFCGNPHSPEFGSSVPRPPPLPSCTSPNSVAISPNPISGACRTTLKP